jgi:O-acetyl-ADP-ribose deacetylase (regulator of RNase III)
MMDIQLLRADIASLKVDAIVAPSDPQQVMEGDRAVVVTGGNLLARFIIHVRVPSPDDDDADAKLMAATRMAVERAEELAVASVGLPAIATGPFGFTSERCARAMLPAAIDHCSRARSVQRAVFCLFGQEEYKVFERVLGELQP